MIDTWRCLYNVMARLDRAIGRNTMEIAMERQADPWRRDESQSLSALVSDEGLRVENQVVAVFLRRHHHRATPAFGGVDRNANIIYVRKRRPVMRVDGGTKANIVE